MVDINRALRRAAEKALVGWLHGQWDRQRDAIGDLHHDLWVWYLETPSAQRKMAELSEPEIVETARIRAQQLLSKQILADNTFQGRDLYSSDSVKDWLNNKSTNRYLNTVLPIAFERVDKRHYEYAESMRSRYIDGLVPTRGTAEEKRLTRAVKSLTEEVNVVFLTAGNDNVTMDTVEPRSRRGSGGHADPTGDLALALIKRPEMREHCLEVDPIETTLEGAGAAPVYDLGDGRRCRPTGLTAWVLQRNPDSVDPYLDVVRAAK